jgi:hypothetical protein
MLGDVGVVAGRNRGRLEGRDVRGQADDEGVI